MELSFSPKNIFDEFNLRARILPLLVSIVPILLFFIFSGFLKPEFIENKILYGASFIIIMIFISFIMRDAGKKYELKMYKNLGEKPTTIVLRWSDSRIDNLTKKRYHKKLMSSIPEITFPQTKEEELSDIRKYDKEYSSAINWLRNYANKNRKKEMRVFQELINYNFLRNLYGLKYLFLVFYLIICLVGFYNANHFCFNDIFSTWRNEYIPIIILILWIVIYSLFVTKQRVQERAFNYALTLLEVCDDL